MQPNSCTFFSCIPNFLCFGSPATNFLLFLDPKPYISATFPPFSATFKNKSLYLYDLWTKKPSYYYY